MKIKKNETRIVNKRDETRITKRKDEKKNYTKR